MTEQEADRILRGLRRYYPGAKVWNDAAQLDAFASVLLDYDFSQVVEACKNHVRTCKFFPFVSELVGALTPTSQQMRQPDDDPARRAWMNAAGEREDAHVEERGGVCLLLHEYGGVVGETLRAHYPDARFCGENCRKAARSGACPYAEILQGGV